MLYQRSYNISEARLPPLHKMAVLPKPLLLVSRGDTAVSALTPHKCMYTFQQYLHTNSSEVHIITTGPQKVPHSPWQVQIDLE